MSGATEQNQRTTATGFGHGFRRTVLGTTLLLGATSLNAWASEGGAFGNYGVGALTVASGFLPPQGETYFYGYVLNYTADRFVNGDGDSIIPDFNLNVTVEASVLKRTWNFKIAGLSVASGLIQEAAHVNVKAGGQHDRSTGNVMLAVQPLILAGAVGNLHFLTTSYIFIPAGDYEPESLANHALNYYTYSQDVSLTWLPTPRWMLDLTTNISINGTNHDTNYHSGDLMAVTWGAQYRPASAPKWQVGLSGLYFNQIEDDRINGDKVPGGFQLFKITGGPQLAYWPTQTVAIAAKWHHEFEVENGPKGDQLWIQAGFPF